MNREVSWLVVLFLILSISMVNILFNGLMFISGDITLGLLAICFNILMFIGVKA